MVAHNPFYVRTSGILSARKLVLEPLILVLKWEEIRTSAGSVTVYLLAPTLWSRMAGVPHILGRVGMGPVRLSCLGRTLP